jgi:hypothetical protein
LKKNANRYGGNMDDNRMSVEATGVFLDQEA